MTRTSPASAAIHSRIASTTSAIRPIARGRVWWSSGGNHNPTKTSGDDIDESLEAYSRAWCVERAGGGVLMPLAGRHQPECPVQQNPHGPGHPEGGCGRHDAQVVQRVRRVGN